LLAALLSKPAGDSEPLDTSAANSTLDDAGIY